MPTHTSSVEELSSQGSLTHDTGSDRGSHVKKRVTVRDGAVDLKHPDAGPTHSVSGILKISKDKLPRVSSEKVVNLKGVLAKSKLDRKAKYAERAGTVAVGTMIKKNLFGKEQSQKGSVQLTNMDLIDERQSIYGTTGASRRGAVKRAPSAPSTKTEQTLQKKDTIANLLEDHEKLTPAEQAAQKRRKKQLDFN